MDNLSPQTWWAIFKHVRRWLANLNRASQARQQQSIKALQNVVLAARETSVYLRQIETGQVDHNSEKHLALVWTRLGFELEALGLNKLAKRCHITGKHWADPDFYDAVFLQQADISLERMEKLAREILFTLKK